MPERCTGWRRDWEWPATSRFQDPSLLAHRLFDRDTNPVVDEVVIQQPDCSWAGRSADFDELYSRFGIGGGLTCEGTIDAVRSMNHHREIHRQVALLLESGEAELLSAIVQVLYQRILVP